MIGIRADANSEIGTGHVMRCMAVAAALKEIGQPVCFVVADETTGKLLDSRGMEYHILHTDYRDMEAELPKLRDWICRMQVQCLLVDSYFVTEHYLQELRGYVRTAYMDDVNSFPYPVDVLINYNIYGDLLPYEEQPVKDRCLLLGTAYVPLRTEFQKVEYPVRAEMRNVLITTGGSDKYNLAGRILEQLLREEETGQLQYHVVSGAFNQHLPLLKQLAERYANIHLYQNVARMSELMQSCDAAITAGGSTMYELSAIGVPILCFSFVENQERMVQTFVQRRMVCYGGNYLEEQDGMLRKIQEGLVTLASSWEMRLAYSDKEKRLVDGQGAMRIAQILCGLGTE